MKDKELMRIVKKVDKMYDKVHPENLEKLKKIEHYLNNDIRHYRDYFLPK